MNNTSCTSNVTCFTGPVLKPWYLDEYAVSMLVLYALVISTAVIGNILICAAVCINTKLRENVASYFIVSLAVSDLCTASLAMPFDLESFTTYARWYHGDVFCKIWTTVYAITVPTSMWNLFVLSLDRYKTLKNPWDRFKASPFMTPKKAVIVIVTLWLYSLGFALIPFLGWTQVPPDKLPPDACTFNIHTNYSILSSVLNFYLPMFTMCFIYFKIYEIARTQYLMPTGLEAKPNRSSMPSAENRSLKNDPKEHENMNSINQENYDSCKIRSPTSISRSIEASAMLNQGLEMENDDKTDRTKTFTEGIEENIHTETNQVPTKQNDDIDQDRNDESNIAREEADVSCTEVEDVTLHIKQDREEEMDIREELTEDDIAQAEKDQSTNELILDQPNDSSTDKNINNLEENDNNSVSAAEQNDHDLPLPRQAMTSQGDMKEDADENLDSLNQDVKQDTENDIPNVENLELGEEKDAVVDPSGSSDEDKEHGEQEGPSEDTNHVTTTPPYRVVSLEMHTYLRKQVLYYEDREKSSSRDSLQSTCTLQSTLPDGRNSVLARNRHLMSASRNTLSSDYGSMEDLTKRKKIFVQNKKAARTISIIVGAFLVCWMPYTTFSIVMNICQDKCYNKNLLKVSHVLILFGYVNSILNPVIFSYQNVQFRISYRKIIKKLFPCLKNIIN